MIDPRARYSLLDADSRRRPPGRPPIPPPSGRPCAHPSVGARTVQRFERSTRQPCRSLSLAPRWRHQERPRLTLCGVSHDGLATAPVIALTVGAAARRFRFGLRHGAAPSARSDRFRPGLAVVAFAEVVASRTDSRSSRVRARWFLLTRRRSSHAGRAQVRPHRPTTVAVNPAPRSGARRVRRSTSSWPRGCDRARRARLSPRLADLPRHPSSATCSRTTSRGRSSGSRQQSVGPFADAADAASTSSPQRRDPAGGDDAALADPCAGSVSSSSAHCSSQCSRSTGSRPTIGLERREAAFGALLFATLAGRRASGADGAQRPRRRRARRDRRASSHSAARRPSIGSRPASRRAARRHEGDRRLRAARAPAIVDRRAARDDIACRARPGGSRGVLVGGAGTRSTSPEGTGALGHPQGRGGARTTASSR